MAANNKEKADIGLIGLGIMGQNLILNMNDHGFTVACGNRTVSKVDHFLQNEGKGTNIIGAHSVEELAQLLKKPRRVMLLVQVGTAVDDFIQTLIPLLEQGDIIIDGGNSLYKDSMRRAEELEKKGFLYIGTGVSGGEDGARYAAKADGQPCCDWVGPSGSGHFVKMVHNGIEYGDMQLICEAYHIMKDILKMSNDEIAETFEEWNKGKLDSFLIQITAEILRYKENGKHVLDLIRDSAGQKGTGKWTGIAALEYGVPVTLIGESVFARCLSSLLDERHRASSELKGPKVQDFDGDKKEFLEYLGQALYASKIISYAQGFMLMREAAKQHSWKLNYGSIALMWRGGCIIRSVFLGNIKAAYDKNESLENLLMDNFFMDAINKCQQGWRKVIATASIYGVPIPCFSTALAFYDGYRSKRLPANLIQAQRDYFGAHTYELLEKPGEWIHTNWTGHGGNVTASTYQH
ncbi:unnamed protein product [Rotaria sp. Silwood1]|nr:unnamed protein product [Rotaria sp. Silwood1]